MPIKVIVELKAKPGRRADLLRVLGDIVAKQGPSAEGFLASTRYEVVGDPDTLVEIAEWQSVEARVAHMQASQKSGVYAPLLDLLAAPFRATVMRPF